MGDFHFDRLGQRFQRNIYGTLKGQLRLELLKEDLADWLASTPMRVLDAGGGVGHMSALFASHGHDVLMIDAARPMIGEAQRHLYQAGLLDRIELRQSTIQAQLEREELFDLIICHAVLEWTRDPAQLITGFAHRLRPGGKLSLMFYNRHSLVIRHVAGGRLDRILENKIGGQGNKLTPINPIDPDELYAWVDRTGLTTHRVRGVRCLFDYLPRIEQRRAEFEPVLALERSLRDQQPYLGMARYLHLMAEKPAETV